MKSHYESEADRESHLFFKYTDEIKIAAHFHRNLEMIFLDEGEQTVFIDGKRECLYAGEGCFVKPYEIHSYEDRGIPIKAWVLVVSDRYVKDYREEYCKNKTMHYPPEFLKNKESNFKIMELLSRWNENKVYNRLEIQGWIDLVFSRLVEGYFLHPYKADKSENFALEALKYLDTHYDEELTLEKLSAELGYSRTYCSMLFNKYVGESFTSYLNRVRAEKATELIENGTTVEYASRKVGFHSRATFYRYYRGKK